MTTYYVAPNGSGSGLGQSSPTTFASVWSLTHSGDTVIALDGRYQGSSNMIQPPGGLNNITVMALNDGGPWIDAQFNSAPLFPLNLTNISGWTIQGLDFSNGFRQVGLLFNGQTCTFRRCCFWDTAGTQNVSVVEHDGGSSNNVWEDCAFFGMGRNIWEVFTGGNSNTCRRCWFRYEGNMWSTTAPLHAFQPAYGGQATHSQTLCENCLMTWYAISMPQSYIDVIPGGSHSNFEMAGARTGPGFSEENCGEDQGIRVLGSLSYLRTGDSISSLSNPGGPMLGLQRANNNLVQDTMVIVPAAYSGSGLIDGFHLGTWSCSPVPSGGVARRITSVIQAADAFGAYSVSAYSHGSTIGSVASPWSDAGGANLCWRYVNGVRQDGTGGTTATPLWPWPMNDRIKAAMTRAGSYSGPCNSCSGGQSNRSGSADVMTDVQALLGTIPAQCVGGVTPPPPQPPPPPPPPPNQTLSISNSGGGGATAWTASKLQSWLTLSPTSGVTPATVTLSVNPTGLVAGTYQDTITVTLTGADNTPQTASVTLTVGGAPTVSAHQDVANHAEIDVSWANISNPSLADVIRVVDPAGVIADSFSLGSPPGYVTIQSLGTGGSLQYATWSNPALTFAFQYVQSGVVIAASGQVSIVLP